MCEGEHPKDRIPMRHLFEHHHRMTQPEMAALWQEAIIVLDANALLNVYRYPDKTRDDFFSVLEKVRDRLWIPYQAAAEFYRNRISVIVEQRKKYGALSARLDSNISALADGEFSKSGFLDLDSLRKVLEPAVKKAQETLRQREAGHPDLLSDDPYLGRLVKVVDDRIGQRPAPDVFDGRCQDAKSRFERKIPPGFMDQKKLEPERYGDALLWFEMIDLATEKKRPILLVTDDEKEDWWLIAEGKKLGARPELRLEMKEKAGVAFAVVRPAGLLKAIGSNAESVKFAEDITKELARQASFRLSLPRRHSRKYRLLRGESAIAQQVAKWIEGRWPGCRIHISGAAPFEPRVETEVGRFSFRVYLVQVGGADFSSDQLELFARIRTSPMRRRLNVVVFQDPVSATNAAQEILPRDSFGESASVSIGYLEDSRYVELASSVPADGMELERRVSF